MSQCPICKKPTDPGHKPFCSQRCADVDLGRWLTESYSLPAKPAIEEEEDAE
ncbi:MAG: DNA gyrase inhibitor YacG [Acidocella sp. 20-61-6]|nr:MAG: DNA gyrase inhibitor YacG [Acidocella sp. 20-61-6]